VAAGTALLTGPHAESIVAHTRRLLDDAEVYAAMANAVNPYGDGRAADRIVNTLHRFLHL
jgi:UDP-N-acetylglucosamine 2-epimerase